MDCLSNRICLRCSRSACVLFLNALIFSRNRLDTGTQDSKVRLRSMTRCPWPIFCERAATIQLDLKVSVEEGTFCRASWPTFHGFECRAETTQLGTVTGFSGSTRSARVRCPHRAPPPSSLYCRTQSRRNAVYFRCLCVHSWLILTLRLNVTSRTCLA